MPVLIKTRCLASLKINAEELRTVPANTAFSIDDPDRLDR